MIYTPENSPGSITVDVEKGEYIYDVLAVDMDNATVEVIDRPLRIVEGTDDIAKRKIRFRSIKILPGQPSMRDQAKLFLCQSIELSCISESHPCFNRLPNSER